MNHIFKIKYMDKLYDEIRGSINCTVLTPITINRPNIMKIYNEYKFLLSGEIGIKVFKSKGWFHSTYVVCWKPSPNNDKYLIGTFRTKCGSVFGPPIPEIKLIYSNKFHCLTDEIVDTVFDVYRSGNPIYLCILRRIDECCWLNKDSADDIFN